MILKYSFVFLLYICVVVCNEISSQNVTLIDSKPIVSNETEKVINAPRPSENVEKKSRKVKLTNNENIAKASVLDNDYLDPKQKHNKKSSHINATKGAVDNVKITTTMGALNGSTIDNSTQKINTTRKVDFIDPIKIHKNTNSQLSTTINTDNHKIATTSAQNASNIVHTTENTTSSTIANISKTSSTTTTTTTTSTTTTTTTEKPKKPKKSYSVLDIPGYVDKLNENNKLIEDLVAPIPPETEPVLDASAQMHTDMFVPLVTIMFTIPLAAGVIITTYRRFRDCWSTRHYRRMDFLVDGMYND